jgi:hypothetical protein
MATALHDRRLPRGRTLHLVDIENLSGEPRPPTAHLRSTVDAYRHAITVRPDDHVAIACNRGLVLETGLAWPGARLYGGDGPNGADLALLQAAEPHFTASHYDRVVIGSGDGIFTGLAHKLRTAGLVVVVVSRVESLSRDLARVAHLVRKLVVPPVAA